MNPTIEVVDGQTARLKTDQSSFEVTVESVESRRIAMQVNADLSSQIATEGEGKIPIISRRSFSNFVSISSGQSQIIGGVVNMPARSDKEGNAQGSQTPAEELMCIVTASIVAPAVDKAEQAEKQKESNGNSVQILIDTKILTASDGFLKAVGLDPNSMEGIGWWSENLVPNSGFSKQRKPIALTFDEHALDLLPKALQSRKDYKLLTHQKIIAKEGKQTEIPVVSQAYFIEVAYDPKKPSEALTAKTGKLQFGTFLRLTPRLMTDDKKIALDLEKEVRLLKDFNKEKYKGKSLKEIPPYSWSKTEGKISISDGETLPIVGQRIAEPILLTKQETSQQETLWSNINSIFRLAFRNSYSIERPDRILILVKPTIISQMSANIRATLGTIQ